MPARNTLDVRLVLSPPKRETFEFIVSATLRPGNSVGLGGTARRKSSVFRGMPTLQHGATMAAVDLLDPMGETMTSRRGPPMLSRMNTSAAIELLGPPRELCRVTAIADFPKLQIVDARLHGVAQELLWQQLRLPEINAELGGVLSESEQRILSSEGLASMGDVASMAATLPYIDMMLPPGLPGEPPALLHLLVRNGASSTPVGCATRRRWSCRSSTGPTRASRRRRSSSSTSSWTRRSSRSRRAPRSSPPARRSSS